ncbi:MAG: DUF885 domain-containing protein [Flavobacteriales bacterium]
MRNVINKNLQLLGIWYLFFSGISTNHSFADFVNSFARGYRQLQLPALTYDYHEYFKSVGKTDKLYEQQQFFLAKRDTLAQFQQKNLSLDEQIQAAHIEYEINFNLLRIALEYQWQETGNGIPENGLNKIKNYSLWYNYFLQKFTSLPVQGEYVMQFGLNEVKRVKAEIRKIQDSSGFSDSASFYQHLAGNTFLIKNKKQLEKSFSKTDSTIRANLHLFLAPMHVPSVTAMEWPHSNAQTPPGMYSNEDDNDFGKNVFMYNFFGGKYNSRAIEWLYMHEAIPGHHLQWCFNKINKSDSLQPLFFYSGNFEGWACHIEYEGKELGLYQDTYSYLGKWEWDLVRSARLVIETGIHYYGWTKEKALQYWQENVPGQDAIAEREITRVTNWPGQAISYKIGAECILQLQEEMKKKFGNRYDEKLFHYVYLSFGRRPLEVIKKFFARKYEESLQ